jgi:hypothetical protein
MKPLKFSFLLVIAFAFTSCSLFKKLSAPHYNSATYQAAVSVDSTMNALYTGFTNGANLSYDANSTIYDDAEAIINTKISIDSTRKYPTQILTIDKTYLDIVESARQDHKKDGNISTNHISVNGALLRQIGHILVTTEKTYK